MKEQHLTLGQKIGKLRDIAEKDLRISHPARTLYFRICSQQVFAKKAGRDPYGFFPLPWTQVATWCGIKSAIMCRAFKSELVEAQYLWDEGLKGCPAKAHYRLNLKLECPRLVNGVIPAKASGRRNFKKHFLQLRASLR